MCSVVLLVLENNKKRVTSKEHEEPRNATQHGRAELAPAYFLSPAQADCFPDGILTNVFDGGAIPPANSQFEGMSAQASQ